MMSRMVTRAMFVLALVPVAAYSGGPIQKGAAKDMFNPRAEVDEFVNMIDFEKMFVYPQHWSKDLPPEQRKQILLELLHRLRNTRSRRVENYAGMFVLSRAQAGMMEFDGHGLKFEQDIFLENGRCAWAIEEILGCYLPNFTVEVAQDAKKLDENVRQSFFKVVEAMDMPEKPKPEIKPANPKDKSGTDKTFPMPLTGQETPRSKDRAGKKALRRKDEPGEGKTFPKDKAGKVTPFSKDEP